MAIGANLFYLRKYGQAIEQLDEVISSNPDFAAAHFWKSLVYAQLRRFADAIEEGKKVVELDNGSVNMKIVLASIYAIAGEKEDATRVMNEAVSDKKGYLSPASVAFVKFKLGQKEEAFSLFEKALEIHDTALLYLRGSPEFEECLSDPRWGNIEQRLRQPKHS